MRARFVYTRPDGGVAITCPSANCVAYLMNGGRWPDANMFWLGWQIVRQIVNGVAPSVAAKYVRAMQHGGMTEHEALWLIAERDCRPYGTGIELWDVADIPTDRTHRDAWRRSQNGGPIWIDEDAAQRIDEQRLWRDYEART